ncbi:MAG TPA: hypothetical protein VKB58_16050 [Terriglobales bacterium]|nr:hypothetical protein [Terriglobales bacterium]
MHSRAEMKQEFVPRLSGVDRYETRVHIGLLIALGLLCTLPVLLHGAPDLSHDGIYHAIWAKQFAMQFWQGDWYPRWLSGVNAGLGGASGFFYPPLASYVSAAFWPLLASRDPDAWMAAGYSLVLAELLSGITAYLWLRSLTKGKYALLGAAVYVIAPYHLAIDLYQRGASAEFWVFVWLPLILLAGHGLTRNSAWALPVAGASSGLAAISHPTVALWFTPMAIAYVAVLADRKHRLRIAASFSVALLLGFGLAAPYLAPAVLDQNKAHVDLQIAGWGQYQHYWLWQDSNDVRAMARYLFNAAAGRTTNVNWEVPFKGRILAATLTTLAAILLLFFVVRRFEQNKEARRAAWLCLAIALIYFFLMCRASALFWKMLPFLKFTQFPYRLNVMLVACVAALAALACPYLLQLRAPVLTGLLAFLVLGWIGADLWVSTQVFSAWRAMPERVQLHRYWTRTQMEFLSMWPKSADVDRLQDFSTFDLFVASHPPKTARLETLPGTSGIGTVQVEHWRPRNVVLKVRTPRDSQLIVNHFYYAGWQGWIAGTHAELAVSPSIDGLIEMDVPAGE